MQTKCRSADLYNILDSSELIQNAFHIVGAYQRMRTIILVLVSRKPKYHKECTTLFNTKIR